MHTILTFSERRKLMRWQLIYIIVLKSHIHLINGSSLKNWRLWHTSVEGAAGGGRRYDEIHHDSGWYPGSNPGFGRCLGLKSVVRNVFPNKCFFFFFRLRKRSAVFLRSFFVVWNASSNILLTHCHPGFLRAC